MEEKLSIRYYIVKGSPRASKDVGIFRADCYSERQGGPVIKKNFFYLSARDEKEELKKEEKKNGRRENRHRCVWKRVGANSQRVATTAIP